MGGSRTCGFDRFGANDSEFLGPLRCEMVEIFLRILSQSTLRKPGAIDASSAIDGTLPCHGCDSTEVSSTAGELDSSSRGGRVKK